MIPEPRSLLRPISLSCPIPIFSNLPIRRPISLSRLSGAIFVSAPNLTMSCKAKIPQAKTITRVINQGFIIFPFSEMLSLE